MKVNVCLFREDSHTQKHYKHMHKIFICDCGGILEIKKIYFICVDKTFISIIWFFRKYVRCLEQYDFGENGIGLFRGLHLILDLEKKNTILNVGDNLSYEWNQKLMDRPTRIEKDQVWIETKVPLL